MNNSKLIQRLRKSFHRFSRPNITYTFQALSEEDRKLWMDAMDGKEPVSVSVSSYFMQNPA